MPKYSDNVIMKEAKKFREAIDNALYDCKFKDTMKYFPKGCCEISSDLFAYHLQRKGVNSKTICGRHDTGDSWTSFNHVWVEVNGLIVDLAADEFWGKGMYCGPRLERYDSMTIVREEKPYDINRDDKLRADYAAILSYLEC